MKKYETPVLEAIQINDPNNLMAAVSPGNDADAKQNDIFFDEDTGDDSGDGSWGTDPWDIKYNLWDED